MIYAMICRECGAEHDIYRHVAERNRDIPICCTAPMERKICAPAVIGDISPYQAMGYDLASGNAPIIKSRSEHRAYLQRNGYTEVGNDMPVTRKPVDGEYNVRAELREAVREVLPKYTR